MTLRLSDATLATARVARPDYDRAALAIGVVHFGPGAFHRAHQADMLDRVAASDPRWGLSEVGINSSSVADALGPQDGLYTLVTLDRTIEARIVGVIRELLTAADRDAILARIAAPATRLLTTTVTEKGYCLGPDGTLDREHPAILADLAGAATPASLIGWLVAGLAERRRLRGGPITIVSCDNLSGNGAKLGAAVAAFAGEVDPDTARWIVDNVRFPSSMVDSITPASDDALRARVAAMSGLDDAWPIQREAFTQWVIEDDFAGDRPPLDAAGAQFARDVAPFEAAKLRLLNGAHSTLAYLGLLLGHATVAEAMADARLAGFVARLMREDIAPSLAAPPGLPLDAFIDAILARFANPEIEHRLAQIAWDGSQKLPIRLLGTIRDARAAGRPISRLAVPVAAWLRFIQLQRGAGAVLTDPLAAELTARADDPLSVLDLTNVFGDIVGDRDVRAAITLAFDQMADSAGICASLR